jgi:hypothetical protein
LPSAAHLRAMPTLRPRSRAPLPSLRPRKLDGHPRRAVTCLNVRRDDKALFDHIQSYWALRSGRPMRQWDAFRRLLELAAAHPESEIPADLRLD